MVARTPEKRMKIEYQPIGFVHSPHETASRAPIQPSRARGIEGTVEVNEELAEGLSDLDGFSHIILISHLHEASPFKLKVVPHLDTELRGLFATRAPSRPNPIGLSVVRLLGIDGRRLRIEGVDLVDGTPVLDIKPYIRDFDDQNEVLCGWLDEVEGRETTVDGSFER
jgi:tRNA-Thr(GGU) m(6)t(6)A37 methyltransferase TsaA